MEGAQMKTVEFTDYRTEFAHRGRNLKSKKASSVTKNSCQRHSEPNSSLGILQMRVHFLFLSARQADPNPHCFSMHTEGSMASPCVNGRPWKLAHWISGFFLFYILNNLKAAIKSSLVWDAPCANAYFATELLPPSISL